ncbi:MAG: hypothetical protein WCN95_00445 [bacterium]
MQTWVDQKAIATTGDGNRAKGARRRILRAQFIRNVPRLRKRLDTPAVLGFKRRNAGSPPAALSVPPPPDLSPHSVDRQDRSLPVARAEQLEISLPQGLSAPSTGEDSGTPAINATVTVVCAPDERRLAKERAVNSIESRLRDARDARQKEVQMEALATRLAEKLLGDLFGGELTRADALVMFNDLMIQQGILPDIRTQIRKKFFGR